MKVRVIIPKHPQPGREVIHEVVEREGHLCSHVYNVARNIGTITSDEETGPECDTAQEIHSES